MAASRTVAAHEQRLAALDALLPTAHPLPDPEPGDVELTTDGGVAISRRQRPDPDTKMAIWGAAEQHRLIPRVGGTDPVTAMAALLAQWREQVMAHASPGDTDTEAVLTWPSRDPAMTQLFLGYGLAPLTVVAARPAGRPAPDTAAEARLRPLERSDVDAALARWLEVVRWDTQFSTIGERPATADVLRNELVEVAARDEPWSWVAEVDGEVAGLLMIDPPERAGWVAPLISASPAGYLGCLVVAAGQRGNGVGAALVRHGHRALDGAGVGVTLLHYAGLNPLSGPFWHRCGYRPLWTMWHAHPASSLRPFAAAAA